MIYLLLAVFLFCWYQHRKAQRRRISLQTFNRDLRKLQRSNQ